MTIQDQTVLFGCSSYRKVYLGKQHRGYGYNEISIYIRIYIYFYKCLHLPTVCFTVRSAREKLWGLTLSIWQNALNKRVKLILPSAASLSKVWPYDFLISKLILISFYFFDLPSPSNSLISFLKLWVLVPQVQWSFVVLRGAVLTSFLKSSRNIPFPSQC